MANKSNKKNTNKKNNQGKKKNIKASKNVLEESTELDEFNMKMGHNIRVASIIIIIFCLVYFITYFITRDDSKKEEEDKNTDSGFSYTDIMVGRSFSIDDGDYFVLYYDKSDENISSTYSNLVSTYRNKPEAITLYSVDMSNGLNKSYASDSSNTNPTSASEISINGPTLIHFNGNTVVEYVEGEEEIREHIG